MSWQLHCPKLDGKHRPCYTPRMTQTKTRYTPSSWTVPTEDDDRQWEALTRDEQVEALRDLLTSPACLTPTDTTIAEIIERTRSANRARRAVKL
jgi:hypothetical protein